MSCTVLPSEDTLSISSSCRKIKLIVSVSFPNLFHSHSFPTLFFLNLFHSHSFSFPFFPNMFHSHSFSTCFIPNLFRSHSFPTCFVPILSQLVSFPFFPNLCFIPILSSGCHNYPVPSHPIHLLLQSEARSIGHSSLCQPRPSHMTWATM